MRVHIAQEFIAMTATRRAPPECCSLEHNMFTVVGALCFRRATTDGAASMIVQMGDREAAVPLRSLQREFGITDDSADGQMLSLIEQGLDFVHELRIGDKLPAEVLTGDASWEPRDVHRKIAAARLQLQLLQWLRPDEPAATGSEADALRRLDEDPKLRQQVADAMGKAAEELGLASRAEIVGLLEQLAGELSYLEALRAMLRRRVRATLARIERLAGNQRAADAQRMEPMNQVRRLTGHALTAISRRFDQVDAQTGEVLATLRNLDRQRAFIRANRDWLYRCLRAWEPILAEWDNAGLALDDWTWGLIGRTYQFLAPRYMPMTEWLTVASRLGKRGAPKERAMRW
jgi:hypothetical protein